MKQLKFDFFNTVQTIGLIKVNIQESDNDEIRDMKIKIADFIDMIEIQKNKNLEWSDELENLYQSFIEKLLK